MTILVALHGRGENGVLVKSRLEQIDVRMQLCRRVANSMAAVERVSLQYIVLEVLSTKLMKTNVEIN